MLISGLNLVTLLIKLGGPFYSNYGLSNKISFAYKRQKKKKKKKKNHHLEWHNMIYNSNAVS